MNSIPSTFVGTLEIQPKGRVTKELYLSLLQLARDYGMDPRGDGANDGKQWQIQIYCGGNYVGGGTTARDGELVLFHAVVYGFRETADYEHFKADMLVRMQPYGVVTRKQETPPLSRPELIKRGRHMGLDVTSQCASKAAGATSRAAPAASQPRP